MQKTIVDEEVGKRHPIRPEYIALKPQFFGVFGSYESEAAASFIVEFARRSGTWKPIPKDEFETFCRRRGSDPWCLYRLIDSGYITLGKDDQYRVTHEFICRCFGSAPDPVAYVAPTT